MTFFLKKNKKITIQTDGSCIISKSIFSKKLNITKKCFLNLFYSSKNLSIKYSDNNINALTKNYRFFKKN
jgi:hypothetical protein